MRRSLAVALLLLVTGCTVWIDATPSGVHVRYDDGMGEGWPLSEPSPTAESQQWTPVPTTSPCLGYVFAQPRLNVRASPSMAGRVGASVAYGAWVQVLSVDEAGAWLEIVEPPGWVSAQWVRLSDAEGSDCTIIE